MSDEKHIIEADSSGQPPEHVMPTLMAAFTNEAGETCLGCTILLSVESPERVTDHIIEVLDTFSGNFSQTAFSGNVAFTMWNDQIPDDACDMVKQVIDATLEQMQAFAASNGMASADGNPLVFSYTFTNNFPD